MVTKPILSQSEQDFVCKMQELYAEEAELMQGEYTESELYDMELKILDTIEKFLRKNDCVAFSVLIDAQIKCWSAAELLMLAQDVYGRTERKTASYKARQRELLKLAKKLITKYAKQNKKI